MPPSVIVVDGGIIGCATVYELAISLAIAPAFAAEDSNEAWKALAEGGHVVLIRHGNAPGPSLGAGGDPPGFRIGDCRTQRNLEWWAGSRRRTRDELSGHAPDGLTTRA